MVKDTKEFNELLNAIVKWNTKHKGNTLFVGSFCAFKGKDCEVIDDRLLAFGDKNMLRDCLKDLDEQIEKEKGDFVNW